MITLDDIRGQPRAIARLKRAVDAGRVAHAYLFCGPKSTGKHTTALALAAAMNCLTRPGHGCGGECDACARIATGIHPDVQTLAREGAANIIPIATIRARIIPQMALPPHEARARFFLIEEATSLQDASANALLKTLEEPPPRTHFVLGTTAAANLLPTIRSRCQRVDFAALPVDLRAEFDRDDAAAEELIALVDALKHAADATDPDSMHTAAQDVSSSSARKHLDPVLESLSQRLHREAVAAVFDNQLMRAATIARRAMDVLDMRKAVAGNAHAHTALEALLHTLRTRL